MSKLHAICKNTIKHFNSCTKIVSKYNKIKRKKIYINPQKLQQLEKSYAEFTYCSSNSLLKKYLTKDVFNRLKYRQTSFGSTLLDCVQSGFANPDSVIGVYASDAEAYSIFPELFDPIIEDIHSFKNRWIHPCKNYGTLVSLTDIDPYCKYITETKITSKRSIQEYPFSPILQVHQFEEIQNFVATVLCGLKGDLSGKYYPLELLDEEYIRCLNLGGYLFKEGDKFLSDAKVSRAWPKGRGIFLNDDKTLIVWVNKQDHIKLISKEQGGNIKTVYYRLMKALNMINMRINFARHRRLGYLNLSPVNIGIFHNPLKNMESKIKLQCKGKCALQAAPDPAVMQKLEEGVKLMEESTSKSLLKKYLTRDIFDRIKLKRTSYGSTLLDCIQSGLQNFDSGIGVYAPDAEAYTVFAELFDAIIEDYHFGFKPSDRHPRSDFGDGTTFVNMDPTNAFIVSIRVRCGRALQGYPFNPCLKEEEYIEIEKKITVALGKLEGELAGQYHPLTGMDKTTQQNLIDSHFLFKEGDRFLQAANASRYWPTGRGIYFNEKKSFVVWINEEDHIRIICMENGGDLGACYRRFVSAVEQLSNLLSFTRDDRLGFVSFCPTNLGTAIRASVHIKVPKLAKDKTKFEDIAKKFNLQIRGSTGEHSEAVGGIYDISNKQRIGLTEYQAVKTMQDGILEMIKIEQSLMRRAARLKIRNRKTVWDYARQRLRFNSKLYRLKHPKFIPSHMYKV